MSPLTAPLRILILIFILNRPSFALRLGWERRPRSRATSGLLGAPTLPDSPRAGRPLRVMSAFPLDPLVSLAMPPRHDAPVPPPIAAALQPSDVLPPATYERVRLRYHRLMTELRKHRRTRLAPHVSILFESRETVLCQVHEVLRLEGHEPAHVRRELDAYACLVPPRGELRATVMIDGGTREEGLALAGALRGRDAITLACGGLRCGSMPADDDALDDAVHYLRFVPPAGLASELRRRGGVVELALQLEGRQLTTFAGHGLRAQLSADLGPPPPRSLLHALVACPWLLDPKETTSPWPF